MSPTRRFRSAQLGLRRSSIVVLLTCVLAVAGPATMVSAQPAPIGDGTTTATIVEVEGSPSPTSTLVSTRTGPDPTGRPNPPTTQRAIDSAIWLWLVALLIGAVAIVAVVWRRAPTTTPLVELGRRTARDEDPSDDR